MLDKLGEFSQFSKYESRQLNRFLQQFKRYFKMEEQKIKIQNPISGEDVDAVLVDIKEFSQRSNKIVLEDGTTLNIQTIISTVARVPGKWDNEGNPFYIVKNANAITVLNAPQNLKKN